MALLDDFKMARRISHTATDPQILDLIDSAVLNLKSAGVNTDEFVTYTGSIAECDDALIKTAILTYVNMHYGIPSNYDDLRQSYIEQRSQLRMSTTYGVFKNG